MRCSWIRAFIHRSGTARLLSGAKIERFAHNDMQSLATVLGQLEPKQAKMIVVDGVYSMEGHIAALPQLVDLADQYRAAVVVDEAHSIGILGRQGRGVCDQFGVTDRVGRNRGQFFQGVRQHRRVRGRQPRGNRVPAH